MARVKKYKEEEVIERAMHTFWKNGYESTSIRMLEKDMGINLFSIYSSFNNKEGVFIESLKLYRKKIKTELIDKLNSSSNGIEDIKQYIYDFIDFAKHNGNNRGCLFTNTLDELGENANDLIKEEIKDLAFIIRDAFANKLRQNSKVEDPLIMRKANNLIVSLQGVSVALKFNEPNLVDNYIEDIFLNI